MARGLLELAEHAQGTGVVVCVENMPPGVHPGSHMADLAALLAELNRPTLALALDTGHANLTTGAVRETHAAGRLLATTHVHDNDKDRDSHLWPGKGSIDWKEAMELLRSAPHTPPLLLEVEEDEKINPAERMDEMFKKLDQA